MSIFTEQQYDETMKSFKLFFTNITFGKKLLLLLAPILTTILSMKAALLGLAFLIIIDLITGIRKNLFIAGTSNNPFKKAYWKAIKSYLLRKTWRKAYEYGFGLIVVVIFETLIFGTTTVDITRKGFTVSELAIVIPAVIEVWSIFENLEAVSGVNVLKRLKELLPPKVAALFTLTKKVKVD